MVWGIEEEGWRIIKYKIIKMKNLEHNTTIGRNVMNEYYIEEFSSVQKLMRAMCHGK